MPDFVPDPSFEAEMRKDAALKIAMLDAATEAKAFGNAFSREIHAPWMPRRGRETIEVEQQDDGRTVLLVNTDYAAAITEWGSSFNPPHAVLRRAVRAAGLDLREASKP